VGVVTSGLKSSELTNVFGAIIMESMQMFGNYFCDPVNVALWFERPRKSGV
jgi:hypothetical protein